MLALALAPPARANPALIVGAAEDLVVSPLPTDAKAQLDLAAGAGLAAIRVSAVWAPGTETPTPDELLAYQATAQAAALTGIRLILAVYPAPADEVPQDDLTRAQFVAFVTGLARALPTVKDFVVGHEPNRSQFWSPQFGPAGQSAAAQDYEQLLAASYDALKAVSPDIKVIGGALAPAGNDAPTAPAGTASQSPGAFVLALGAAYRASGRTRPIMDELALHPNGDTSGQPPSFQHGSASTTIGIGDYPKLVRFLTTAFDRTGQPGSTLPILYDQYGVQTAPPPDKRWLYTGAGSPLAADAVSEATQAAYYQQALALAFCQPNVTGLLFFHTVDDPDLAGWQSGLFYPDLTPKSDLPAVKKTLLGARRGVLRTCPGLAASVDLLALEFPRASAYPADNRAWSIRVGCVRDCLFLLQLEALPGGRPALAQQGRLAGGTVQTIALPARRVAPGSYRFTLRLVGRMNPGPLLVQTSSPFTVG